MDLWTNWRSVNIQQSRIAWDLNVMAIIWIIRGERNRVTFQHKKGKPTWLFLPLLIFMSPSGLLICLVRYREVLPLMQVLKAFMKALKIRG